MNQFISSWSSLLAAGESAGGRTVWEFGRESWQPFVIAFVALLLMVGWIYRRDTMQLSWSWKVWLFGLRAMVVLTLLVIALDPQERTETEFTRPSRVAVLVDTSVSMSFPEKAPSSGAKATGDETSRAQAVEHLFAKTPLLEKLRDTHDVAVYTFDSKLQRQASLRKKASRLELTKPEPPLFPGAAWALPSPEEVALYGGIPVGLVLLLGFALTWKQRPAGGVVLVTAGVLMAGLLVAGLWSQGEYATYNQRLADYEKSQSGEVDDDADDVVPDWATLTAPRGGESRLGESLLQLYREARGETLSGVVVITDGVNNAGIEPSTAKETAVREKIRVSTVGVGSTERPVNLLVANGQSPTHVHLGDGFTLTAFVQGQGFSGREVEVELLSKMEKDEGPLAVVETRRVPILEDGIPAAVPFDIMPLESGRRIFNVRVRPVDQVRELTEVDNERALPPVEVVERRTKVLFLAGGPMRDYQFVRNLLHRDPSIELDVWLQTGDPGISQDAENLLFSFPETRDDLFAYDVIVAFDPNWKLIPSEGLRMLTEWVFQQAGGIIFVAGDVYTSELALAQESDLDQIRALYPVVLNPSLFEYDFKNSDEIPQPWPVEFTRAGLEAEFLQLTDNPVTSSETWNQFTGIYRCYPSGGPKAGATVYANFSDPRSVDENGKPILLASQFYGAGRTLYLGSGETWRLRAVEEEFYERLWIKLVREVGQGRLLRGTNRGVLLLERSTYPLGSTVQVRANLLDPQFRELIATSVPLEVFDPQGRPMPVELRGETTRPGQFLGAFSANLPGRYRLELPIPESKDQIVTFLQVELPNLEFDRPEQDAPLLQQLATKELGGAYFPLEEAAAALPGNLPDRSTTKIQFDVPRTLWDKQWVLFCLVGLLSLEWLTRKLLKLA